MANKINFSNNYEDLSTERGFQFEFKCDRCGAGIRTKFQASATGTVTSVLNSASNIFGGILGSAASVGDELKSATWEKSHDDAFEKAVKEVENDLKQCPRCSGWVCKDCWNDSKGLCKQCAPDIGVEASAAQASRTVEEVWAHAKVAEDEKPSSIKWDKAVMASCPKCEAPLKPNAKFCHECGAKTSQDSVCTKCKANLPVGAKFCQECGEKTE